VGRIPAEAQVMKRYHEIRHVRFEEGLLALEVDGQERKLAISEISRVLSTASEEERIAFEVTAVRLTLLYSR
jgi:hypothetical protein